MKELPTCFFARGHDRTGGNLQVSVLEVLKKQDIERLRHHISKMTDKFKNGLILGLDAQKSDGAFSRYW
jgi:hypothetical protein